MCTVSWFFTDDGYELLFNRDERRSRLPGQPPRRFGAGSQAFLAPVDRDAGGTWILANAHGLSLCLLNRYQDVVDPPADGAPPTRSRGQLMLDLATSQDAGALESRVAAMDLAIYQPFTLLALADGVAQTAFWTGRQWSPWTAPQPPLVSSAYPANGATAARQQLWREMTSSQPPDRSTCLAFHRSHRPQRGIDSPCMHRDEAVTVSLSHVIAQGDRVTMSYLVGSPCEARDDAQQCAELPLNRAASAAA